MLVEHNMAGSQSDEPGGGEETEEVGLVGWVVTKVSIGSNHFLIHYLLPLPWSP